jgi:hypothetical protein
VQDDVAVLNDSAIVPTGRPQSIAGGPPRITETRFVMTAHPSIATSGELV